MKIYNNIAELAGRTPLMRVSNLCSSKELKAEILCKLERFNPAGSVKDRAALYMLRDAEERGVLKKGSTIIEPTSGNTGIGLAAMGISRGYRVILTMPETMSEERRSLLKAYGAELVLTDGCLGMQGAIDKAKELLAKTEGSVMPSQFENPANVQAHLETTGVEIWEDTEGTVDVFVAGVGTGGTLTGVAKYLKSKNPNVQIVAVEPGKSPVLSKGKSGAHGIQGIGAGFVPSILDTSLIDRVVAVCEEDAYAATKELVRAEGILVGLSSGAALFAAMKCAGEKEYEGKRIIVLLPDMGERYLSMGIFS